MAKIAKMRVEGAQVANGRLLIVDNEPSVLKSYALSLGKAGFSVTKASNGREALQYIEKHEFDAVLSSFSMPRMDGLALLSSMRARSVELPVILMLDKVDNRAMLRAAELGAMQALVKPIAPELLRKTARLAVQQRRSRFALPADIVQRRGSILETASSISATVAKNEFGRILEKVVQGGGFMVITRHDSPKAVLMSIDEFHELSNSRGAKLDSLTNEFDALLERMQTQEARAGMRLAFDASPEQLGQAAVAAARKRA